MFRTMKNRNQGFTLMELLIVMAILGLLASLVGPAMLGKVDTARVQTAVAKMRTLSMALDTHKLDTGAYPDTLQELLVSSRNGWAGPYLKKEVPLDPWKNPYIYTKSTDSPAPYILKSLGEDGKEGGEGNAADLVN